MFAHPHEIFHASRQGLKVWWDIVLPALLPFMITSELLMKMGIVKLLGFLLEPFMQLLFALPGTAALVVLVGFTSGAPIGSILTAKLRKDGLLTRTEAEKLMSFTSNASPLFVFGAVGTGMLGNPQAGVLVGACHYLANLTLGLFLLRFHGRQNRPQTSAQPRLAAALSEVLSNQSPVGQLLTEAALASLRSLANIGAFITLFAVILESLRLTGILHVISLPLSQIAMGLGFHPDLSQALATGLFEITLGCQAVATAGTNLTQKLLSIVMILGWGGISIHAQVASAISGTDIRLWPFLLTRLAHAVTSFGLMLVLLPTVAQPVGTYVPIFHAWYWALASLTLLVTALAVLALIGFINYLRGAVSWLYISRRLRF